MENGAFSKAADKVIEVISTYGLQVLGAVLILILGRIVSGIVGNFLDRALKKANVDASLRGFLVSIAKIAVIVFAVIAALAKFGVQTTSFVAIVGAAGLAVGLALQGSLANFAAGVMLLLFKPIRIGDLIEAAGYLGIVKDVGLFMTIIDTLDNQKVIIPNNVLTSGVINNVNGNGIRRVDLMAGISYSDDIPKVKAILRDIVDNHPKILKDPSPDVAVFEHGDSSINLVVRPWCKGDDYWDVWFEVMEAIKLRFDEAGVSIPFPQRDVHLFPETQTTTTG